jgi:hypothetical protein
MGHVKFPGLFFPWFPPGSFLTKNLQLHYQTQEPTSAHLITKASGIG